MFVVIALFVVSLQQFAKLGKFTCGKHPCACDEKEPKSLGLHMSSSHAFPHIFHWNCKLGSLQYITRNCVWHPVWCFNKPQFVCPLRDQNSGINYCVESWFIRKKQSTIKPPTWELKAMASLPQTLLVAKTNCSAWLLGSVLCTMEMLVCFPYSLGLANIFIRDTNPPIGSFFLYWFDSKHISWVAFG